MRKLVSKIYFYIDIMYWMEYGWFVVRECWVLILEYYMFVLIYGEVR